MPDADCKNLPFENLPFEAAKQYDRSIRNQMKQTDKYYILSFEEPRVYGIFMTLKTCKKALMEQRWDTSYMLPPPEPGTDKNRVSNPVIGIVMHGKARIQTEEVCDAPPVIIMQKEDYQKCIERAHPNLKYVGAFRATANTCIRL